MDLTSDDATHQNAMVSRLVDLMSHAFNCGEHTIQYGKLSEAHPIADAIKSAGMRSAEPSRNCFLTPLQDVDHEVGALDEKLVHVIARLLQEAANVAEWGLKLLVVSGESNALGKDASSVPRRLH